MQSTESNRQRHQSNLDQNNLDLNNRFHLASNLESSSRHFLPNQRTSNLSLNESNYNQNTIGHRLTNHFNQPLDRDLLTGFSSNLSNSFSNQNLSSHSQSNHNSLIYSNNRSLSNYPYSSFSCATTLDQLRPHRSLGYMTTNFNNGPITSSYVNQASVYTYNSHNKFNSYHQPFVNNSMQTNVLKSPNINSLQSPYYLTNNNNNHSCSSSTQPTTNKTHNLAKGTPPTVSMAGPKGPQALLLTTKDGQQTTMVVQQQPNSNSVADCNVNNVTTAVLNNTSSNPQVITINKPLTQNSGVTPHPQQQILVSNTSGVLPANMVLNMNPTSRQVTPTYMNAVNNQISQRGLAPSRVVLNNSGLRLSGPPMITQRGPGGQNVLAPNISIPSIRGAIILKTENGIQLLNVGGIPTSSPNVLPQAYRFTTVPVSTSSGVLSGPGGTVTNHTIRPLNQQIVTLPASLASNLPQRTAIITQQPNQLTAQRLATPQHLNQPLTIQTTQANQATNAAPSQMSPNTAKKKCKNFLSTLIRLASDQPEQVATNVRNLIQGLIDGNIQPEDFTVQLQRELNSSPQPCLVPFLKKSLPYLRYSLMMKELTIDGVRAPPPGSCSLPIIPQLQFQQRGQTNAVRIVSTSNINQNSTTIITNKATPTKSISTKPKSTVASTTPVSSSLKSNQSSSKKKDYPSKSKTPSSSKDRKEKKSKEDKESFLSSLRDDDDINDVAAMGGVNLMEEHQRILANEEFVGAQIRSCKDEPFLSVNSLQERLNKLAMNYNLDEVPLDVVSLVSHAAQERLKTLVEKLGIIAEHRIENLKMDNRYEITQDVRSQIKFLDELDKLEKKRHHEQEREMLMKAAKSRSKAEDPEQLKLKQKAKEMQRAELEEARQREANETALLAIGPRKKLKTSHPIQNSSANQSSFNNSSNSMSLSLLSFSNSSKQQRRVKRVNLRDLQFLMEQEKQTVRTPLLYSCYMKTYAK